MFKIFSTCICWVNIENETLHFSSAVRPLYRSLGVKGLNTFLYPYFSSGPICFDPCLIFKVRR